MRDEEHHLQVAVATYLKYALPTHVLWTATLNGAYLTINQRVRLKAAGMRPGIADLVLTVPGVGVKMIELKTASGTLSAQQKEYRTALGSAYAVCRSVEEVEQAIVGWGITPRASVGAANRYALDGVPYRGTK